MWQKTGLGGHFCNAHWETGGGGVEDGGESKVCVEKTVSCCCDESGEGREAAVGRGDEDGCEEGWVRWWETVGGECEGELGDRWSGHWKRHIYVTLTKIGCAVLITY